MVENACDRAISLVHAPCDNIFRSIMNPVCPNPGLEQYFPPVGRFRIFPSFVGIAKSLRLFLSSCVSASRRPEERPGTFSRRRVLARSIGGLGQGRTHIMFSLLKVVNSPHGERGHDDGSNQRRLGCSRHEERARARDERASIRGVKSKVKHRTMVE
jgi:hypothetical protein